MEKKSISVIVPCFNEGGTIRENLKKIDGFLKSRFLSYEIIAVNDGSTDNTAIELEQLARELPIKTINKAKNEGKGGAVRTGMLETKGDIAMFLDADLAIPITELEKFLPELECGYDLVIASRFIPGLKILRPVLWYRRFMERVFRLLRMLIINHWRVRDTQCGFKVFSGPAARDIFPLLTINRFAFDAEVIFIATERGSRASGSSATRPICWLTFSASVRTAGTGNIEDKVYQIKIIPIGLP
jgi:dolichyl-phosphate beta-glucosyltransferase